MTDEPVRIEFTTNAPETTAAIESINAALRRIPESGAIAGQGIDSFISRSITALGRLSAEISRVSGELRSLGSAMPGTAGGGVAPTAPPLSRWDEAARRLDPQASAGGAAPATPIESMRQTQQQRPPPQQQQPPWMSPDMPHYFTRYQRRSSPSASFFDAPPPGWAPARTQPPPDTPPTLTQRVLDFGATVFNVPGPGQPAPQPQPQR